MNNERPMFSIIMACYNHGKYVETAIRSILDQTYQNFELIVADDGSTDNSWEIIQKFKDRIKCFRLEENDFKKCTEMMMDMTTGRYLAQMSSDDYWCPQKLEVQVKLIEENPNCYAYFTWAAFTDENLNVVNENIFSYENRSRYEWFRTIFEKETVLAINTMVTINDKEKWLAYSQGVLNYRQLTDQMVFLRMFLNGDDVSVYPSVEMKVRRHDNCIGTLNRSNVVRTCNETISIWAEMWEVMDDDFFLKAFHNDLYDKSVSDKTEILCERMLVFLKLAKIVQKHQTTAINYFTTHYCDEGVTDILQQKYNYTREDFFELTGTWGIGEWMYGLIEYERIFNMIPEEIGVLSMLSECNSKFSRIISANIYNQQVLSNLEVELKEYMVSAIAVIKGLKCGKKIRLDAWWDRVEKLLRSSAEESIDWAELANWMEREAIRMEGMYQAISGLLEEDE